MSNHLATISALIIYPIKSCAGIPVERALVAKYGLAYFENPNVVDRKWMIVDESGTFLTQRKAPKMALISPRIEGNLMILSAPGMTDLNVSIDAPKTKKSCRCWSSHIFGYAYGGDISKWLSTFLAIENLDLVSFGFDLEARKPIDDSDSKKFNTIKETDETIYADYSAFMILSEASINDVNSKLSNSVTVRNFRPTILVKDCDAYNEDTWTNFVIGESFFRKMKHCTRCLLTTVDPEKGVKSVDQEPLKTLKTYRMNKELYGSSPMFGINVAVDLIGNNKQISIGDKVLSQ